MRFLRHSQIRFLVLDARFGLNHRVFVIVDAIQHVLPVELGDHVAFFDKSARIRQFEQHQGKVTTLAHG